MVWTRTTRAARKPPTPIGKKVGAKPKNFREIRIVDNIGSPNNHRMVSMSNKMGSGGRKYGPTYSMTVQTRGKKPITRRYR